jgi:peptidoglycan/LPS O-acetylase OafA/YrhL
MSDFLFSIVLSAEYVVDVFFWMTAFLGSYFMLTVMKENDGILGNWGKHYLHRLVRLLPTYLFTLFFFWKFLVLYGGEGPMFYMYTSTTECSKYWFWHVIFLNNLIPWSTHDTCLPWTWYLANDFQFYLLLPMFVTLYYKKRNWFYSVLFSLLLFSKII